MDSDYPSPQHIETATEAALAAGKLLKTAFFETTSALVSTNRDIKTQADMDANEAIFSELKKTGIPILSEEGDNHSLDPSKETAWIIDPLDGTVNFFRGLPLCCTSIALWADGKPAYGVVYDFLAGNLIAGGPRQPSTCNGKRIQASATTKPSEGIITTGFPNARNFEDASLASFITQIQEFRKVRLLGSAAFSLTQVALGRVDAYFEEDIYLWDIAAGLPILLGAGGVVDRSAVDPSSMKFTVKAASTPQLLESLKC